MGSTHVVGVRAYTLKADDGTQLWALAHQTYESNVYPKTPHWSINVAGTIDMLMQPIALGV